jgi:anti-sigma factor RsiW
MSDLERDDPHLLINAAIDGELDAAGAIGVERRLADDPNMAKEHARLIALQKAVRGLPRESAPDALRARVLAMAATATAQGAEVIAFPRRRWAPLAALAASVALGVVIGAGGLSLLSPRDGAEVAERAVVADYVRSRISGRPVDLASNDRHNVKPWLAGKVATPTVVADLSAEGFTLAGGRVDVVDNQPVATLVYQRREHMIDLTETPARGEAASDPRRQTVDGYALSRWTEAGRRFIAISDLPASELDVFVAAFRRAAAVEREDQPSPTP